MKWKMVLIALILFLALPYSLDAEENCYYVADRDLQRIYEHFEGISLEDAIDNLILEKSHISGKKSNNIIIQFNGGLNKLFIGQMNRLDILIENSIDLAAVSLGLEFSCPDGLFEWVVDSGIILNRDAFNGEYPWEEIHGLKRAPDTIHVGGVSMFPNMTLLPPHPSPTLLYSMYISIPDDTHPAIDGFCIDNIYIPQPGNWIFATRGGTSIIPNFQNSLNTSGSITDAPAVCFDIVKPGCGYDRKSSNSNIVHLKTGEVIAVEKPFDIDDFNGVFKIYNDNVIMSTIVYFNGNIEELESLGVNIGLLRYGAEGISASFPIELLPRICQKIGVKRIDPITVSEPKLN
jgi:hypothetical protein